MHTPFQATRPASLPLLALCCALAATVLPVPVLAAGPADDPPTELRPVVVHAAWPAAATVESISQAREQLDQRAGGTGLVDGQSYRDGRVGNLADALGFAAGVFVQPRFGAEEARLSIRGSGLQRTFHGRGIVVLQDGIPLNLADGSFDFQAIEPLAARYIEVWRGANALEYGAATLGGAINLVSPTGMDAPPLAARVEAGSSGSRRVQLAVAGERGRFDGYATVTDASQQGFRDHAAQENHRLNGNAGWRSSDRLDTRLYFTHIDSRSQLPGNLTLAEALREPSLAAPGNLALDQRRDYRLDRIAARLAWAPREGSELTLSLFRSDKSLHHPIFQVLDQDSSDSGVDLHWRDAGDIGGHRTQIDAGLSYARGTLDDRRFANVAGKAGEPTNRFDQQAGNLAAWFEWQSWWSPRWVGSIGAQALESSRRSRDLLVTGGRDESFDLRYHAVNPKFGMRFIASETLQVFANLSRSAEPPSFGELSGGTGVTPVSAQRGTTAELGLRLRRENLAIDAAAYRARVDGELLSLQDPAGNPLGTINAGRTLHQGLELGLQWRPAPPWRLSLNYLRNDFRFDGDPTYGDNTLAGVPPQQARVSLCWRCDTRLHIEPGLEWTPQGGYIDHANTFAAPGHTVANLKLGGDLAHGWQWFADLRNLADRRWIAGTGVIADARGADSRNFLPGDGRSLYVGVEWQK